MNDMIKLIVMGVGGAVVSFLLILGVFWFVLSPGDDAEAMLPEGDQQAAQQQDASASAMSRPQRQQSVPGGEVLAFADVLGENIPLEASVDGYGWARWGMSIRDVMARLASEGVADTAAYSSPRNPKFVSLVALNPDEKRYKVEYRFFEQRLFHIEVYYSDYFENNSFNAFLLSKMSEYGRPYDMNVRVDDLGNVILNTKWDTENSLIELVSRPNGRYSLFLDHQIVLYQLGEARKSEERLAF
jgi:hypothetical protein